MTGNRTSALRLMAAGLFGIALYGIAAHVATPATLGGDFAHGVWVGICMGLEVVGLAVLLKSAPDRNA